MLMNTCYHEGRHSEQWFLMARMRAGLGDDAPTIMAKMHVTDQFAIDQAVANPLKPGPPVPGRPVVVGERIRDGRAPAQHHFDQCQEHRIGARRRLPAVHSRLQQHVGALRHPRRPLPDVGAGQRRLGERLPGLPGVARGDRRLRGGGRGRVRLHATDTGRSPHDPAPVAMTLALETAAMISRLASALCAAAPDRSVSDVAGAIGVPEERLVRSPYVTSLSAPWPGVSEVRLVMARDHRSVAYVSLTLDPRAELTQDVISAALEDAGAAQRAEVGPLGPGASRAVEFDIPHLNGTDLGCLLRVTLSNAVPALVSTVTMQWLPARAPSGYGVDPIPERVPRVPSPPPVRRWATGLPSGPGWRRGPR